MNKTQDIRERFESSLVEGLKGIPLTAQDGAPVLRDDGTAAVVPPPAQFLAVVRAYLKDRDDPEPAEPVVPQPGAPKGVLADYVARNNLPFAPATKQ
jgi:hypothetical protein